MMSLQNQYDAIILGADLNGLMAAIDLSRRGKRVLLIEEKPFLGGMMSSPGSFSEGIVGHPSAIFTEIMGGALSGSTRSARIRRTIPHILMSGHGETLRLGMDIDENRRAIGSFNVDDGRAYIGYRDFVNKASKFLQKIITRIPPDIIRMSLNDSRELFKLGFSLFQLGQKERSEFLKVAPMSVADLMDSHFTTKFLKAGIAIGALRGVFGGPHSAHTAFNLLVQEAVHAKGSVVNASGMIQSLSQNARDAGVQVIQHGLISEMSFHHEGPSCLVRMENGTQYSALSVVSTLSLQRNFDQLIRPIHVPVSSMEMVRQFRSRGICAVAKCKVQPDILPFLREGEDHARVSIASSLNDIEKSFDPVKYDDVSDQFALEIFADRVGTNHSDQKDAFELTIHIYFVPYQPEGGWDESKMASVKKTVENQLNGAFPGWSKSISSDFVLYTPRDIETIYGVEGGHLFGGDLSLDQMLVRPHYSAARYQTDIDGLFLAGDSSFPGGYAPGVAGVLCSKRLLVG